MAWSTSTRAKRLPGNWHTIRRMVLNRDDYRCRIQGPHCTTAASEADHIVHGDDHSLPNLQAACAPCHKAKTQAEARAARPSRQRPLEQHPGLLG